MRRIVTHLRNRPLQRRVTLLTTAAVALVVVVTSVVGYAALRASLYRASQSIALAVAHDLVGPATDDLTGNGRLSARVQQAGGVIVEAVSAQGVVTPVPGEVARLTLGPEEVAVADLQRDVSTRTGVAVNGERYAVVAVPLTGTGHALVVARPLALVEEILAVQRAILLSVTLAAVLAAALIGALVARSGLRPVRRLTSAVQHVTATKDLQPIAIPEGSGDLSTLAGAFNDMLRSLASSRERQARLIADAGHELRTPLTSLRTNVDLLAADVRSEILSREDRTAVLGDVQAQLVEFTALIGDLVHLARDESAVVPEPLDFSAVVHSALDRVRRRAQSVTFDVELDRLYLVGHADSLERAVINLLDNAVKWSPPGGVVRVQLEGNRLRVADQGPGIPEHDLPYVFDRFYRGDTARKTHGTGLGLSIVAKSIGEHGGSVAAGRSAEGGAEFILQLPGATSLEALSSPLVAAR